MTLPSQDTQAERTHWNSCHVTIGGQACLTLLKNMLNVVALCRQRRETEREVESNLKANTCGTEGQTWQADRQRQLLPYAGRIKHEVDKGLSRQDSIRAGATRKETATHLSHQEVELGLRGRLQEVIYTT